MALKVESLRDSSNQSLGDEDDFGVLQICEETSDDDEGSACDKQKVIRTLEGLSDIPTCLVKAAAAPAFGSVAVSNSENVQFGNNTYFNGPVTIKQVFQGKTGVENSGYTNTDDDLGGASGGLNEKQHTSAQPIEKLQILVWHKVALGAICVTVIGGIIAMILLLQNKLDHHDIALPTRYGTKDKSAGDTATNTTVVGYCYENFQVIIITFILLPLTLLLVSGSLLTRAVAAGGRALVRRAAIHENCLVKSCAICNKPVEPLITAPAHLRIVSRTDWLAQPVEGALDPLIQPVPWVIITHTATESCSTQSQCVLRVRLVQQFHVESRGWDDIGYNFLVGGDGSVYHGRGWDYEGAHTKHYNKYSIGIAFIGTFNQDEPTKQQVEACEKLIRLGVALGKLRADYRLLAHRQLMSTLSPGDRVVAIISRWPRYVGNATDALALLPPDRRPPAASAPDA